MNRFVCVHGHFYQPPRENPWLEALEFQESAYPYHDWNERVAAECYAPNASARILDGRDRITRIVNNYANISFNFGPTLMSWLRDHDPETYGAVLAGDRISRDRFGHGSAIAQAYNHMIMPLANARDRRTQVTWGLRDFKYRFGRPAAGMWLPETAVDLDTLDVLAEAGIRFTILAPAQASAVRPLGTDAWSDVKGGIIDTTRAYKVRLPSGRDIATFFYDGLTSRAVAFEGLLRNGETFARRLLDSVRGVRDHASLAHIATDGETYGHHHRHGDMALAYALHQVAGDSTAELTNYTAFLDACPPQYEVRIIENTSWSCVHGIERWRSDCGCRTGGEPGWNQSWRTPLREALDWLRDEIAPLFERTATSFFKDPWRARDAYIDVILERSAASLDAFCGTHANDGARDRVTMLRLMELQRHAMLMYTSCGWFFNELSGIETVQVLRYAARVVQLAEELFGEAFEPGFLDRIELASSNVPEYANGRRVYEKLVRPARVDLNGVAAHYVVSSLFAGSEEPGRLYCYRLDLEGQERRESGATRLYIGRGRIASIITLEEETVTFAVLHFGGHNLSGGIRRFAGIEEYRRLADGLTSAFSAADIPAVVELLARFPEYSFSLKSLFADRQREILARLMGSTLHEAEAAYRTVYQRSESLMRFLIQLDMPVPRTFTLAAELIVNRELQRVVSRDVLDLERARTLLADATALRVELNGEGLAYAIEQTMEHLADEFHRDPRLVTLTRLSELTTLSRSLPFEIDLWKVQNIFYEMVAEVYPQYLNRARQGDTGGNEWLSLFTTVGEQLAVAVD